MIFLIFPSTLQSNKIAYEGTGVSIYFSLQRLILRNTNDSDRYIGGFCKVGMHKPLYGGEF